MAFNSNILNITLDGTGTEIPTLNISDNYSVYFISGTAIATGNYSISPTGSPVLGDTFVFKYSGTLSIGAFIFTIFGQTLTSNQLISKLDIVCYYNGSAWVVDVHPSFISTVVETANIKSSAITTALINNDAVDNNKLATMATISVKTGDSIGTPQDTPIGANSLLMTNPSGTAFISINRNDLLLDIGDWKQIGGGGTFPNGESVPGYATTNFFNPSGICYFDASGSSFVDSVIGNTVYVRKVADDWVEIQGVCQLVAGIVNGTVFTLPTGYRPSTQQTLGGTVIFNSASGTNVGVYANFQPLLYVRNNGQVRVGNIDTTGLSAYYDHVTIFFYSKFSTL